MALTDDKTSRPHSQSPRKHKGRLLARELTTRTVAATLAHLIVSGVRELWS
jgi:hypothetical protein